MIRSLVESATRNSVDGIYDAELVHSLAKSVRSEAMKKPFKISQRMHQIEHFLNQRIYDLQNLFIVLFC